MSIEIESVTNHVDRSSNQTGGIQLIPVRDSFDLDPLTFSTGRFSVGSAPECDVQISVDGVAEKHCLLVIGRRRSIIQSWSPKTWINDGAVRESTLKSGDHLIIGPVEFLIKVIECETSAEIGVEELPRFKSSPVRQVVDASILSVPVISSPVGSSPIEKFSLHSLADTGQADIGEERKQHVDEMLSDVQSMLEELLEKKRTTEAEFMTQQEKLVRYESDLKAQHDEVEERLQSLHALRIEVQNEKRLQEKKQVFDQEETFRERRQQLEQQQADLYELQAKLNTQQELLEAEQLELKNVRSKFNIEQAALSQLKEELDLREKAVADLELKSGELVQREAQLNQSQTEMSTLENQLEAQQAELVDRQVELDLVAAELEERQRGVTEQTEEYERRQSKLMEREQLLSAQEEKVKALTQQHSARNTELDIREEAVQQQMIQLQSELQTFDKQRIDWKKERDELQQELALQADELKTEQAEVARLRSEVTISTDELREQETALRQREEEIAVRQTELDSIELQLTSQEEELSQKAESFTVVDQAQEDSLKVKESELAVRAEKLAEAEKELITQREELERKQSQFEMRFSEESSQRDFETLDIRQAQLDQREAELDERAQPLFAQESELALSQQSPLETSKDTPDAKLTEDLHQQLSSVIHEREHLHVLREELQKERDELAQELRELRINRDSLSEMKKELDEKLALAVEECETFLLEKQAIIAERQEFEVRREEYNSQIIEIEEQNAWIRDERANLLAERDALEMERELLTTERNVLQEQALQLKTLKEGIENSSLLEPSEDFADQTEALGNEGVTNVIEPLAVAEEQELLRRNGLLKAAEQDAQPMVSEDDSAQVLDSAQGVEPSFVKNELEITDIPRADTPQGAPESNAAEDEPLQLRSELAALFGLETSKTEQQEKVEAESNAGLGTAGVSNYRNEKNVQDEAKFPSTEVDIEPEAELKVDDSSGEENDSPWIKESESDTGSSDLTGTTDENESVGEDSVADYMERLLARTRRGGSSQPPSTEKLTPPATVVPMIEELSAPVVDEVSKKIEKKRILNSEDRDAMRANMDSFRELANASARKAVAKSSATRAKSALQMYVIGVVVGWLITIILLSAEFWLETSQRTFGVISALVSLVLTVKAVLVYLDVQRNVATSIATFTDESDELLIDPDYPVS